MAGVGHLRSIAGPDASLAQVGKGGGLGKRFWRLRVDATGSLGFEDEPTVESISFHTISGGASITPGAQAALRSFASSNVISTGSFSAERAFQGGYWWGDDAVATVQSIGWRFAEETEVNEVKWRVRSSGYPNYQPKNVTVQSSTDGEVWVDEWSETNIETNANVFVTTTRP